MAAHAQVFRKRVLKLLSASPTDGLWPAATLVVRFSGLGLSHVGDATRGALEKCLARAKNRAAVTVQAWLTPSSIRRPARFDGPAAKKVQNALAKTPRLPKGAIMVSFKDGDPDEAVPDAFALYASLAADPGETFCTEGGFLSVALPLEQLESAPESLVALGDELVDLLRADVAWLGPGVWLEPQCFTHGDDFPDDEPTQAALFGEYPQIEVPSQFASRAPFSFEQVSDQAARGFFVPSWVMWAEASLARKVKKVDATTTRLPRAVRWQLGAEVPWQLSDARYRSWQKTWAALSALHVTYSGADQKYFLGRFGQAAGSVAQLKAGWAAEQQAAKRQRQRELAAQQALTAASEPPSPKLLTVAERAKEVLNARSLFIWLLPPLYELVAEKKVTRQQVEPWLGFAVEHRAECDSDQLVDAAAVCMAAGDEQRALTLVRQLPKARDFGWHGIAGYKKDVRLGKLRKHPEFIKALYS